MSKVTDITKGISTFLTEVKVELKKCSWPSRQELIQSTIIVLVSVIIVGMYVSLSDTLVMGFLRTVVR